MLGFWVYLAVWVITASVQAAPYLITFLRNHDVQTKPYWPDRASGFGVWGNLILDLAIAVLGVGILLYAVYFFGYFGLETTPIFWVIVFICLICAPLILILPIAPLSMKLWQKKKQELDLVGLEIFQRSQVIRDKVAQSNVDAEYSEILEEICQLRDHYDLIEQVSVFPFSRRLFQSWAITYFVQAAWFVAQFMMEFT